MSEIRVAELFAGVGGFRLGLEGCGGPARPGFGMEPAGPFRTVWANQWEPPGTGSRQFAARCYEERFGGGGLVNEDIARVLDGCEAGTRAIPDVDMVVGGFPCQDYSVARPLSQSRGIEGGKGVLWWEICRFLELKRPRYAIFENVDRLLKSPARRRGRDFAVMLSCLARFGYRVEWRVVDAAEYGAAQRRRRVYVWCELGGEGGPAERLERGVMARAFPARLGPADAFDVPADPYLASEEFGAGDRVSRFRAAGAMVAGRVATCPFSPAYDGPRRVLADVLVDDADVPGEFFIDPGSVARWEYLKGAKREERVDRRTGFAYAYSEGSMSFPDPVDRPGRTILTGEGGSGPSRTKHVVRCADGRLRRLVPEELERLQGFPAGWTDTGMTAPQRAFCMGNALVVSMPRRIGRAMCEAYGL